MSGELRPPGSGLLRLPIAIDLRAVSFEEGARAGLSVAVLVAAHALLHAPILLEAGLGALLTCLCDSGGLVARRVPPMACFAVLGGALIAGFGLRTIGYPLIGLACIGIFVFGFARIYGQAAQQVGNLLSVVLVLSLDRSFHNLPAALHLAGAFVGGAAWALLLTMVIWRLHPNRPMRQAVARVYLALAALCDDLRILLGTPGATAEHAWARHARAHRHAVRDAIEQARAAVSERLRAGPTPIPAALQSLLRLESADGMFGALIAMSDLLETSPNAALVAPAGRFATGLAGVLRAFVALIRDDTDEGLAATGAAIAALARERPKEPGLRRIAELLVDRLRATLNMVGVTDAMGGAAPGPGRRIDALLAPLRANLTWRSAALRHAARAALVAAAGLLITFTWPTSYQHWLTITLVLTLQPYFALTLQRALERIGGTVVGGLIAAALSLVCHTPLAIAAAIFPLSVLALSVRAVNFGLYVAALTPMIVLLVELGAPSHGELTIVAMRALYTLIGGTLAVLGCVFLWPSWEPDRLDDELRNAVRRNGHYAGAVLRRIDGLATQAEVEAARRAAGIASNNLEVSLSRAVLEPTRSGRDRLDAAMVVDAALRRMGGRLSAMQIDPTLAGHGGLAPWRAWIAEVTTALDQPMPPPLPARPENSATEATFAESLGRIARQLELSAGALRRYARDGRWGNEAVQGRAMTQSPG